MICDWKICFKIYFLVVVIFLICMECGIRFFINYKCLLFNCNEFGKIIFDCENCVVC